LGGSGGVQRELVALVRKTVGLVDPLRLALHPLRDRIELALVYGSVAKGEAKAGSDVDLLVVSNELTSEDLYRVLSPVEQQLSRPIHPTLLKRSEFERRRAQSGSFVQRVLGEPVEWLMGGPGPLVISSPVQLGCYAESLKPLAGKASIMRMERVDLGAGAVEAGQGQSVQLQRCDAVPAGPCTRWIESGSTTIHGVHTMRRTPTVLALLSLVAAGLVASTASATEPASTPATAQPATPAAEAARITKSRSNIQNNREATPADTKPAPAPETQGVVKTKTKSNQSND
jgi:predicted nucleotidyltransferase